MDHDYDSQGVFTALKERKQCRLELKKWNSEDRVGGTPGCQSPASPVWTLAATITARSPALHLSHGGDRYPSWLELLQGWHERGHLTVLSVLSGAESPGISKPGHLRMWMHTSGPRKSAHVAAAHLARTAGGSCVGSGQGGAGHTSQQDRRGPGSWREENACMLLDGDQCSREKVQSDGLIEWQSGHWGCLQTGESP